MKVQVPAKLGDFGDLEAKLRSAEEAVLLTGEDGVFCRGLSLEAFASGDVATDASEKMIALLRTIAEAPVPIIACVDGEALGGGLGIAAACDLVIATERSTFGLPELLVGLIPAVVFPYVSARVGPARARRLALMATTIPAAEARAIGLVDKLGTEADAPVRHLARLDGRALGALKRVTAPEPADERSLRAFTELADSAETQRRVQRFIDGHAPWSD